MRNAAVVSVVMLLLVVGGSCWGADNQSAWHASATAFPTAPERVQAGVVRLLVSLSGGDRISVTYLNETVVFVVKGESVVIESPLAAGGIGGGIAGTPFAVAGAKPWEQPGTRAGEEIVGPDGGKMVWVPAGEFMMGSSEDQGAEDEHPQHKVRLTKGFWLGKCTVTNAQYRTFCQATGRAFPQGSNNGPNHPVVYVSWEDAKAYCNHFGLVSPTEAQWEYAARGTGARKYPWGDDWDPKKCCNDANKGTGDPPTLEVGSLPAGDSWCGASDMAGNVWEWCADWYDEGYYAKSPGEDPPGPASGTFRILRGGSWYHFPLHCRSAIRDRLNPSNRLSNNGFRVARTP